MTTLKKLLLQVKLCEVPHVLTILFTRLTFHYLATVNCTPTLTQTPTVAASDASSGTSVGAVAGGVTGTAVAVLLLALIVLIICVRRRKKRIAAERSDFKNQIGKYYLDKLQMHLL